MLDKDIYFLSLAKMASLRGTCVRRQVGCILVNSRKHIIATGYNGNPAGWAHCGTKGSTCGGGQIQSGKGLSICEAIHAEQNALLQCSSVHEIETAYCTTVPCDDCAKLLLNTSVKRVVALETYPSETLTRARFERGGVHLTVADKHTHSLVREALITAAQGV